MRQKQTKKTTRNRSSSGALDLPTFEEEIEPPTRSPSISRALGPGEERRDFGKAAAVLGLCLLFVLFAFTPLLRTGLLARDMQLLSESHQGFSSEAPFPIENASLAFSTQNFRALEASQGRELGALYLRAENLLFLLLSTGGLWLLTRRLLLPWCGVEQAKAAASAASVLLVVHPLAPAAIGTLDARGELIGFTLALYASALFLRGRQERQYVWTATSFVLCATTSFASGAAVCLPLFFAGFELFSSHRYRPLMRRMRTALTSFLVFGLASGALSIVRSLQTRREGVFFLAEGSPWAYLHELPGAREQLGIAAEKLGLLVLPANFGVLGIAGAIFAGGLFLVSLQPALVAARSAPRLWSWLLVLWFLSLFAAELVHAPVRVGSSDLARAYVMLPSLAVMSAALGIASTALSGARRICVPFGMALGYACLCFANGQPWHRAAADLEQLARDLRRLSEEPSAEARVLVVDPPRPVHGVDPLGNALDSLLGPPSDAFSSGAVDAQRIGGVAHEAFRLFLRQPESKPWRSQPLRVLVPRERLGQGLGGPPSFEQDARRHVVKVLPNEEQTQGPRTWRALRSPILDLEPQRELFVRASVPGAATAGDERPSLGSLGWSSARELDADASMAPVWVGTPDGPVAYYNLEGAYGWFFGGKRRLRFVFDGGELQTESELIDAVDAFEPEPNPLALGPDWVFDVPDTKGLEGLESEASYRLVLFDLKSFKSQSYSLEVREDAEGLRLYGKGATRFVRRIGREGGGPLVWSLSYEVGGVPLLRSEGRIE